MNNDTLVYVMLDANLRTGSSWASIEPNVGLVTELAGWKTWLRGGISFREGVAHPGHFTQLDAQYPLGRKNALRFEVAEDADRRVSLSFRHYW